MANRLAQESSPYLKQHQDNPVDWYAWGEEALGRARAEDKPVLLSVGYSACHWCHVMAHECFENPEIAQLMNEHFINIKVDREERPDLDQVYQNVAQIMTHGGGWPLTVFLTPDLRPFFGGTYFPPEDKYGRPGFPRLLKALSEAWKNDRRNVLENAEKLTGMIGSLEETADAGSRLPDRASLEDCARRLLEQVDQDQGGMGGAPKFPNSMGFYFLWRMGLAADNKEARDAAILTLVRMAKGGIYDQLGGGFHRYSVDATWSVPHFEKMLYDNGLLLKLYAEVLLTGEPHLDEEQRELFLDVLSDTAGWVMREMTAPLGGFYAAQDADTEGEEGKFFVWTPAELAGHLTPDEAQAFSLRYGVTEGGNFESGSTVLFQAMTVAEVSARMGLDDPKMERLLESARAKLFTVRSRRVVPGLDNKILVAWNGLMISGLLWAGRALKAGQRIQEGEAAVLAARRAYSFVRGFFARTDSDGCSRLTNGFLDDYAFMAIAALDQARFSADSGQFISDCGKWLTTVHRHFSVEPGFASNEKGPGWYFTADDQEKLIQRPKTISDQAIPSGTGVVLGCLAAMAEIGPDAEFQNFSAAEFHSQMSRLFPIVQKNPYGSGELLCAALLGVLGPVEMTGRGAEETCIHPHVFATRKPGDLLMCHQKTCSLPLKGLDEARDEAMAKTRF